MANNKNDKKAIDNIIKVLNAHNAEIAGHLYFLRLNNIDEENEAIKVCLKRIEQNNKYISNLNKGLDDWYKINK